MGGTQQEVNGRKIGPQMNPTGAAYDELRLGADGRPISLVLLGTVPARDSLSGFAISQDASMLAYANSRQQRVRHRVAGDGQDPGMGAGRQRDRGSAQPVVGG